MFADHVCAHFLSGVSYASCSEDAHGVFEGFCYYKRAVQEEADDAGCLTVTQPDCLPARVQTAER